MKDKVEYYINCGYPENVAKLAVEFSGDGSDEVTYIRATKFDIKLALSALVDTYGVNVTSKPVECKDGVEVYEFWCPGHHEPDYNPEVQ